MPSQNPSPYCGIMFCRDPWASPPEKGAGRIFLPFGRIWCYKKPFYIRTEGGRQGSPGDPLWRALPLPPRPLGWGGRAGCRGWFLENGRLGHGVGVQKIFAPGRRIFIFLLHRADESNNYPPTLPGGKAPWAKRTSKRPADSGRAEILAAVQWSEPVMRHRPRKAGFSRTAAVHCSMNPIKVEEFMIIDSSHRTFRGT